MELNRNLKKQYAIFSDDVLSKDKYRITKPSKLVFNTREQAKSYIIKNKLKGVKILVVYGYGK